jgi:hypothetical protein
MAEPKKPLRKGEEVKILYYHMNGLVSVEIGARPYRTESTICGFLKSYEKSRVIFLPRGRPPLLPILNSTIDHMTGQLDREPRLALQMY